MGRAAERRAIQGRGNLFIYLFVWDVCVHACAHTCTHVCLCVVQMCADVLMPEDVRCPALSPFTLFL